MAADTFSSILGWLQMQPGNDNNTWGNLFNSGIATIFEQSIAGVLSIAMTTGATNTSLVQSGPPNGPSPTAFGVLKLTGGGGASGNPATNTTLQVPNLTMKWCVFNTTTGDVLMQTPTGATICIPVNTHKYVWCDGANVLYRHDRDDVGEIKAFGIASIPPGFFECNGAALSQTLYPDLFAKASNSWGALGTNPATFPLPLMTDTGRYLRSRVVGTTDAGTSQANTYTSHSHTASTSVTDPGHVHANSDPGHTHGLPNLSHAHSITDRRHSHSDAGHAHSSFNQGFVVSAGAGTGLGAGNTLVTQTQGNTQTGFSSLSNEFTGIGQTQVVTLGNGTVNGAVTGITITSALTGISATTTNTASGGTETRPETAVVRMCVRY